MKKILCLLLLALLVFPMSAAFAEGDQGASLKATLTEAGKVNGDNSFSWLDDRDQLLMRSYKDGYALLTPEGETLFTADYERMSYLSNGYFEAINESGINTAGVVNSEGKLVIPMEYSDFKILSEKYAIAVVLEETDDDAYDYASGFFGTGDDHYNVTSYDFYDLASSEKIGSLNRSDYNRDIKVYHDGFLVEARDGTAKWYNLSLEYLKDAEESFYRYDVFENGDEGILRVGAESSELVLAGHRFSYEVGDNAYSIEAKLNGLYGVMDGDGNIIVPCEFTEIKAVEGEYAIVGMGDYSTRAYGFYHIGEGLTAECQFADFQRFSGIGYLLDGYALFIDDDKLGYVNMKGDITSPAKYKKAIMSVLGVSYFVTDLDGSQIIVAADGTETKVEYAEIYEYDTNAHGYLLYAKNNDEKWGLIDCYGAEMTEFTEDYRNASFASSGKYVRIDDTVYKIEY